LVEKPLEVDLSSLRNVGPVRVKAACKDPWQIGGLSDVFVNLKGWVPELDELGQESHWPKDSKVYVGNQRDTDTFMEDKNTRQEKDVSSNSGDDKKNEMSKSGDKPNDDLDYEGIQMGCVRMMYCLKFLHVTLIQLMVTSSDGVKLGGGDEIVIFDFGAVRGLSLPQMSKFDGGEQSVLLENAGEEYKQNEKNVVEVENVVEETDEGASQEGGYNVCRNAPCERRSAGKNRKRMKLSL
ncbi:hypothetical protein GUJ93_ZPchr0011g28428, partial [Zizania palustris]